MTPVLYSFRRCPYAMRARLALARAGITVVLREVVLARKPAAMLEASPKGTVPVLVLPNGPVLDESLDIMAWALGATLFSPREAALVAANDGAFKTALDRYKYPDRKHADKTAGEYRDEAVVYLHQLDGYAGSGPNTAAISTLEFAVLPFVRQFRSVDEHWFDSLPFIALHQRLQHFLNSASFAQIMTRFPEWEAGQPPLLTDFQNTTAQ